MSLPPPLSPLVSLLPLTLASLPRPLPQPLPLPRPPLVSRPPLALTSLPAGASALSLDPALTSRVFEVVGVFVG